ncbi:MAG: biotin transporter BioY [Bacteroidetes bacterium]|nr:biotin transporter BioY [Bacteroidota bacterium]MDA1336018.1 biotin transporter BioY [Bacteroidota bacterium]
MLTDLIRNQSIWIQTLIGLIALGTLMALSPVVIQSGDVPITLQSLLVVFIPIIVGWKIGVIAVIGYLVAGGLGAPVFSDGAAGWHYFSGSTGGFLMSFPIAALLSGFANEQFQGPKSVLFGTMFLFAGQFIILVLGLFWYRTIVPVEETMLESVKAFMPALLIKTSFGGLALVLIHRLLSAALRSRSINEPQT